MKQKILITRAIFPEVLSDLGKHFDVEMGSDEPWSSDTLRARAADKVGLMVWGDRIDDRLLSSAPQLQAVANMMVGFNNIDLDACTRRGILATNTPDVLDETTADMAWALILATARRITQSERWLRSGNWRHVQFRQALGLDVHHTTLGILGMGRIGRAVARRARGFNMKVIYFNRHRLSKELEKESDAKYCEFDEVLKTSDFLSINMPYSAHTHHLIGQNQIAMMKPNAIIINTARGGIIDESALIHALKTKAIAGAGLDVFENEPVLNPDLFDLDNVVLAPHIGSATRDTRIAMARLAAENLKMALEGQVPPCLINPEVLKNLPMRGGVTLT